MPDSLEVQREAEKVHSSEVPEHSGPIQTRTMAELFVQQGSVGKAIEIRMTPYSVRGYLNLKTKLKIQLNRAKRV